MNIDPNEFQIVNKGTRDEARWYPIEALLQVVEASRINEWNWTKNSPCKYLELRIDMRNGLCLIKDRTGKVLTIEEVMKQS
jgi:hypothetical protein